MATTHRETQAPKARNAMWGAFLGFFVDMFDIYLPIVALAPALIYFVPETTPASTAAIIFGSIFAATLVARPLGAFIFGHFADTIGRKRVTIIAVAGFGTMSIALAVLPGYQQWGMAAVALFIIIRFVDGIFVGGEYTGASPLAMEEAPKEKRGLYGAIIMTGFPLAFIAISLITLLMLSILPAGGLDSPYVQWGWRIPFLFGALIAFVFIFYFSRFVDESDIFARSQRTSTPIKALFSGQELRDFLQVFVMMNGFWLTGYTASAVLPGILASHLGLSSTNVTIVLVISYTVVTLSYLGVGVLSQRIGRRPTLISIGLIAAAVSSLFYYLLVDAAPGSLLTVILLTTVVSVLGLWSFGLATVYINERFHTGVRASGFGLGYSLSIVLPSFYAYYQAGLQAFMPFEYTGLVLLIVGGMLIFAGAAWGPETKDVDFSAIPPKEVKA